MVRILLEGEGFAVIEAADGNEAIAKIDDTFALVILDIMMPGRTGISACVEIRRRYAIPILFLTAKGQDSDKMVGFSAGGDDYLVKPFSCAELAVRVKAMLRRYCVYGGQSGTAQAGQIQLPGLTLHTDCNEVRKNGEEILLTDLEYRILLLLAQNRKKIFSAQNLYESVWGEPYFYTCSNTVMVHIRNLRQEDRGRPTKPALSEKCLGEGLSH